MSRAAPHHALLSQDVLVNAGELRQKAKTLLDRAKTAVELAIEQDEVRALRVGHRSKIYKNI